MNKPLAINTGVKIFIVFLIGIFFLSCNNYRTGKKTFEEKEKDGPRETLERDIRMMKDPALGIRAHRTAFKSQAIQRSIVAISE